MKSVIPAFGLFVFAAGIILVTSGSSIAAPATQVADLRSFFHGEPPPVPKAPPPRQLAVVTTANGVSADAQIENFMRAFADAIKAREGNPMLPRLSEKYAIDDLPGDKKPGDLFIQAIERIPGPAEIIIKSVEKQNNMRIAKMEFRYSADNVKLKTFHFDAGGKLLWSDLFKLQVQRVGA